MEKTLKTVLTKNISAKKLNIERGFAAPVNTVWRAWTDSKILDQWWAPKQWKDVTKSMDFRPGGTWMYYMEGPEGARHYCRADYETIVPFKSYTGMDAFCDENGKINTEFPRMHWDVKFKDDDGGTLVQVEVTFKEVEDLHKIIEMGFEEGFTMAHGNLDELLAKELV